jgi:uncharacterized alkaline shock family protein YloU
MRATTILAIIFYTLILSLIGGVLMGLSLHLILVTDLVNILEYIYNTYNLRIAIGVTGLLLIFIGLGLAQLMLGKIQREKTIAFTTPSGQVTISLVAIEDFIKRLTHHIPEVKELKSDVTATKKGIEVYARVALWSNMNIPETTEKIQEIIRRRIQEMLGIEETLTIKVHVAKIITKEEVEKEKKRVEEPEIPFRGWRT